LNFLYVFLGGGLGAMARYGLTLLLPSAQDGLPRATLVANIMACIILGYLMGYLSNKGMDSRYQLLLMTGFCGGFSTFSTFSAEHYKLLDSGHLSTALLYIGLSVLTCLAGIWLGYKMAQG